MAASCGDCCQGSIWKDDLHRLLTELNGGDEVKTDEVTAARRLTRSSHAGAHHSGMVRLQRNLGQNHGGHSPRSGCNPPEALTAPCCAARSWTGCCGAPTGTRAARSSCQSCVSFRRGALLSPLLLSPTVALPSLSPPCRGHVLFAAFAWTALCTLLLSRGHRSAAVPSAQTASACATAGIAVAMWYSHVNFIKPQLQAQAAKLKHGRSTDAEHAGADEGWSQQRRRRGRGCVLSSKPVGRRGSVFLGFLHKGVLSSLLSNT